MMSDDDQPLVANKPTANGSTAANGRSNGHVESDSSMSEDDMPLVCLSFRFLMVAYI